MRFLLDEHIAPVYRVQLLRAAPELEVWLIGDPGAPARGTLDPEILIWCEENNFTLVTNNRRSMPRHLVDHLDAGRHIPGILVLNLSVSMGETIAQLMLIAGASAEDEYQDLIVYLPVA